MGLESTVNLLVASLDLKLVQLIRGAMAVGNGLALLRPPAKGREGDLARAPLGRSVLMVAIGLLAAVWALASLLS